MRMLLLDNPILKEATTLGVPQASAPGGTGECELTQHLLVSLQGRGTPVQVSQERSVLIWGSEVLTEERLSQDHAAIERSSSLFQEFQLPVPFLLPPTGFTQV